MQRLLLLSAAIVLLLAGGSFLAVKIFINTDHIRQHAEDSLSGVGSTKAEINGGVEFELFPSPLLIFKDVQIYNIEGAASTHLVSIREARAHVNWTHIFSRMPRFNDLTLINPIIELELLGNGKKNWHALMPLEGTQPNFNGDVIPSEIKVRDGQLVYRVQTDKTELSQIDLNLSFENMNGPYLSNGTFTFENEQIAFNSSVGSLDNISDAMLNLSSPSFSTVFEGKTLGDGTLAIAGITKMDIQNLSAFTGGLFPVSSLPTYITSEEEMKIEGAFEISSNKFSLRELSIESESIKASAEIVASLYPTNSWDIESHIDLLNIDGLMETSGQNISLISSPDSLQFSLPIDSSLLFHLTADKIILRNDNILNTLFDAEMSNQQFIIHSLEGVVPGKSDFEFTGAITHNGIRPLLEGEIELNGTNFNALMVWLYPQYNFVPKQFLKRFVFNSQLSMMPTRIRASNIEGNIDEIGVHGEFELRPEERSPSYRFDFELDRVDLSKLRVPDKIIAMYQQLKKDVKDPFSNSFISTLNGNHTFLINGKNFFLNGNRLDELTLDLTVSADQIELRDLSAKTEESDVSITYDSDLTQSPPTLNATISGQALNADIFFPPSESNTEWNWSQERFNFLGLEDYIGSFKAKLGFLKANRLRARSIIIDSDLKEGVITLKRAQGTIGGGPFIVQGKLGIGEATSFGLSYGINGSNITDILNIFSDEVNMRGMLYASGKATSYGSAPLSLINNLTGDVKLSAKNILVNNLGLTKLIQTAPLLKSAIDLDSLKQESLTQGTTLFAAAGGNLNFKGGVASTTDLKASTQYSRGLFAANVDLRSFLIKALSKHRFAINASKTLSVDLDLSGPLISPEKELDVSQIEKFITDRAKRR